MNTPHTTRLLSLLIAVALFAAACAGSDSVSLTSGAAADESLSDVADGAVDAAMEDAATEDEAETEEVATGNASSRTVTEGEGASAPVAPPAEPLGSGVAAPEIQPVDLGRDIIFTANVETAVTNVAQASAQATEIVSRFGGLLFGQQSSSNPSPTSVLTFKVQPTDFQAVLAELGQLGEVRNQNISADDVTERVVDLESRITTAEASVQRLRGFLEDANDLDTIASLENQLLQRETNLEQLKGQLRTIQDRVDLATIVLTIVETLSRPQVQLEVSGYNGDDDGVSCPGQFGSQETDLGETMTLCYEVINVGDTPLTNFTLSDPVAGFDSVADLTVVFGDPGVALESGDSFILAWAFEPERSRRSVARLGATPVGEDGAALSSGPIANTQNFFVSATDPGGVPSFSEGLEGSWNALKTLGQILLVVIGALLPFIWLLILAALAWRWLRSRRKQRASAGLATTRAQEPPPEPTTPDQPIETRH